MAGGVSMVKIWIDGKTSEVQSLFWCVLYGCKPKSSFLCLLLKFNKLIFLTKFFHEITWINFSKKKEPQPFGTVAPKDS